MPKKKLDSEKAKKISVSVPNADWQLVEVRLIEWRCGASEYIQRLIRDDTHHLWVAKNKDLPSIIKKAKPIAATKEKPASVKKTPKFKVAGAEIVNPSEISDGGPSTAKKGTSRRTG